MIEEPDIFEATGYRHYLSQWTAWKKASSRSFSLRQFAARAGFSSHTFLPKLLDGTRNLTPQSADQVASALGLFPAQARFFLLLVEHDQCDHPTRRDMLFEQLSAVRRIRNRRRLGSAQADYYDRWHVPVLRQLAPLIDPCDPARIGELLTPPVPASEVRKALATLESIGLLQREGSRLIASDSMVDVDRLPLSAKSKGRHDILQKGIESLHRFPAEERTTRCLLLGLSRKGIEEVQQVLDDAARRCLEIAARDERPVQVAQIVLQSFPVTKRIPE